MFSTIHTHLTRALYILVSRVRSLSLGFKSDLDERVEGYRDTALSLS